MTVPSQRPSRLGFTLGIVGAATYLVGTLLGPGQSIAQLVAHSLRAGGGSQAVSLTLGLYWSAALVLVISILGLRRDRRGLWAFALFGASAIWVRGVIGFVVVFSTGVFGMGYGTLIQYSGQGIAFLGGLLALIGLRRSAHDLGDEETSDERPSAIVPGLAVFGFSLALSGALLVVVSSFLPSLRIESLIPGLQVNGAVLQSGASQTVSRYQVLLGNGIHQGVVGFLEVYGNSLIVGALAFAALVARRFDRWAAALTGAAIAWVVPLLTSFSATPSSPSSGYREFVLIGARGAQVGEILLLIGALVAIFRITSRSGQLTSEGEAARGEYGLDAPRP